MFSKTKETYHHITVGELKEMLKDCIPEANVFHSTFSKENISLYKIRGIENHGNYIVLFTESRD